jgi:hypothetical protein
MQGVYKKMPGSRLYMNGAPMQSIGCCGQPQPTGNAAGGVSGLAVLGIAAVGLLVLFPKVWDNFQKGLWGK